jgi:hypothetical protein
MTVSQFLLSRLHEKLVEKKFQQKCLVSWRIALIHHDSIKNKEMWYIIETLYAVLSSDGKRIASKIVFSYMLDLRLETRGIRAKGISDLLRGSWRD